MKNFNYTEFIIWLVRVLLIVTLAIALTDATAQTYVNLDGCEGKDVIMTITAKQIEIGDTIKIESELRFEEDWIYFDGKAFPAMLESQRRGFYTFILFTKRKQKYYLVYNCREHVFYITKGKNVIAKYMGYVKPYPNAYRWTASIN